MGSLWRDSVHGALYGSTPDDAVDAERAIAVAVGLDPAHAIALIRALAPLARTRLAADVPGALAMAHALQPDLIVAAGGGEVVAALLQALNADPLLQEVPVIVLASGDEQATRISAMRGGALAWLPDTADVDALLARVRMAVRMRRSSRWREPLAPPRP